MKIFEESVQRILKGRTDRVSIPVIKSEKAPSLPEPQFSKDAPQLFRTERQNARWLEQYEKQEFLRSIHNLDEEE